MLYDRRGCTGELQLITAASSSREPYRLVGKFLRCGEVAGCCRQIGLATQQDGLVDVIACGRELVGSGVEEWLGLRKVASVGCADARCVQVMSNARRT